MSIEPRLINVSFWATLSNGIQKSFKTQYSVPTCVRTIDDLKESLSDEYKISSYLMRVIDNSRHVGDDTSIQSIGNDVIIILFGCTPGGAVRALKQLERLTNESESEEELCIICEDNEACVVLYPCCHWQFCLECRRLIKNCSICNSTITGVDRFK